MEKTHNDLERNLKKLNTSRILINLALVLFILINVAVLAVFVVFLVLFIVTAVRGNFNAVYLSLFVMAVVVALLNNIWFILKIVSMRRRWRIKFKNFAVPYVFSREFEEAGFTPKGGIKKESVLSSGIVGSGNHYYSEDLLVGKYKGVSFVKADVKVCVKPQRGSSLWTTFMGQWMIFDFNKPVAAYVRVFERGINPKSPLGLLLGASPILRKGLSASKGKLDDVERIQVEDVEFNRKFEIVTRNPHTAFYILTPHFIEAVKFLERQVMGQLILAFFDNRLHVAVNTNHNDFEAKLSLSARENMDIIQNEVVKIKKFIDILRLDNDYFKP